MFSRFTLDVKAGQIMVLEKFSHVCTGRDRELEYYRHHRMQAYALKALQEDEKAGFDALLAKSAARCLEKVWDWAPIEIDGPAFDQLAARFAQYHMQLMLQAKNGKRPLHWEFGGGHTALGDSP